MHQDNLTTFVKSKRFGRGYVLLIKKNITTSSFNILNSCLEKSKGLYGSCKF